jgi:hypothetical protein
VLRTLADDADAVDRRPADPRLEVALNTTWDEMTPGDRAAERARDDETTHMLEERIAYREARLASSE